ncbi:DUF6398 domain-containing protein [Methanospirillum hungatei]|uniref:DUF6398 domain-containing protein n=1 Tax=Methanospirillum hungatei TaxID=2203 RepID=UPI0026EDDA37|nr:DUF6398 domain-containing protein [Methanospirillum hungatei]MCA1915456.1 DUF6398 domain-containing protein [Methanospirillum hungatei]
MTDAFCNERLDEEYAGICRHVAGKLARKRDNKITRGKTIIWVALSIRQNGSSITTR